MHLKKKNLPEDFTASDGKDESFGATPQFWVKDKLLTSEDNIESVRISQVGLSKS